MNLLIGCAGWTIPGSERAHFPEVGSHLERYASVFSCVEINSSFYRPHRPSTYERWAGSVTDAFRFAVKVPREITHELRLLDADVALERYCGEVQHLGAKLGPLLVQLPPSLNFDLPVAETFFQQLRVHHAGLAVCEPRHPSWFTPEADRLLKTYQVARVAADPALAPAAAEFGGSEGLRYLRLHGTPKVYYSAYSENFLTELADRLRIAAQTAETWCIFDNTAEGAAIRNALSLREFLTLQPLVAPAD